MRLDLLLHVLEVVVVGDVAVLGVHHVAEHPILQQGRVHLGLTNENMSCWLCLTHEWPRSNHVTCSEASITYLGDGGPVGHPGRVVCLVSLVGTEAVHLELLLTVEVLHAGL